MSEEVITPVVEDETKTVLGDAELPEKKEESPASSGEAAPIKEEADGKADAPKVEGAPEKYEDFTFPEGVEANKALVDNFNGIAKELNLTQDQAQRLVELQTQNVLDEQKASDDAFNKQSGEWLSEAKSDKEIGGPAWDQSLADAKIAITELGSQELIDYLDSTGLGNNVHILKFLAKVGKNYSNDRIHGGGGAKTEADIAALLYPSMSA